MSEEYQIDRGVPLPGERLGPRLSKLEVGDSIEFELYRRPTVQSYASRVKRDTDKEFTIKKISDVSARIWRTK